jgi:hypothetical protein
MQQGMVKRFPAEPGSGNEYAQILYHFVLSAEMAEPARAQHLFYFAFAGVVSLFPYVEVGTHSGCKVT